MKNLYQEAKNCFLTADPDEKLAMSLAVAGAWDGGLLEWQEGDPLLQEPPLQLNIPGRLESPVLVDVKKVKNRGFKSLQQRASLIHSLAHIELTAVNLAWDSVYRYRHLPKEYYDDWVQTAKEETQHFYLLRQSLRDMGYDYGDFPAHNELWQMAVTTADDLMARMAIVHRVLEARALDVVPFSEEKFRAMGDRQTADSLVIIANDEIGHVNAGSRWFRYRCEQEQVDPDKMFFTLMQKYLKSTPKGPFNRDARMKAGFSLIEMQELERLDAQYKQEKTQKKNQSS
ncbi:MAG: ferritin-like domain-containing protein [gamma proteobacterium symbiont of Bathyaustriella thionipta]|nr:ferritin-like domain-containing protein [gamma proteobacterium symbiont of Bathyaustriella thionipta]MCU7950837.1 ferritin-like domain-containing protein [gamma proteobacterium symbiont of Bathyaustriella thionipta]MCU7952287.1 ferritin-like domain-containing protein [gamma proteobacterium symbiont of Bathyaustriella thionipta]MCU7957359.1 ferritin-like domain-containing protein [gamma proteobacterium symbiont of Bathyaustriella thionipta]MCU7966732.1 ferritin-like domain-containing protein 